MHLPEDAYGRAKRQMFVANVIRETKPRTILDFGCGTGTQLTWPLAVMFPEVSFLGVDSDARTIDWARRQPIPPNLAYEITNSDRPAQRYDMIIASEVLEHVEKPDELLHEFRGRLVEGGRLIVTVPNGHGPFETMSLIEHLLTLGGVLPLLRAIKRWRTGALIVDGHQALTLAVSPHINFFSLRAIKALLHDAGFKIRQFRPRTVFCGFINDRIIRGHGIAWNAQIADGLPAWCASDWMFECAATEVPTKAPKGWRRTAWGRFRRYLSERRWAGVSWSHR